MRLLEIRYGGFRFRIAWPFFLQPETKYRAGVRLDGRAKITQSEIARLFAEDFNAHQQ